MHKAFPLHNILPTHGEVQFPGPRADQDKAAYYCLDCS